MRFPPAAPPSSPILSPISRLPISSPSVPTSYRPCRHPGTIRSVPCLRRRPSLPCSCPPIARPRISPPVTVSSDSANIASPSMPPARPDIAAARPSRRMAPRDAGRVSLTCQFGAGRHGSRWRPLDMSDTVPYACSRRSSGQRIPDTDIEARESGGMRHACRDLYRLRYRVLRHIAFSAENPFPCDFGPFAAERIICSGWVWLSRAYWNHGRGIAHGGSARLCG